ncbi:hypothetical protein BGZ70_004645 [Mortierella alpina]|uniref:Uncharacterized protein n=1 Tax=Mortierella alpina TaxID=64518 RepID=A0A9P6IQL7_MORAP|nr:hypothetical protein BGZ70_004645 [Mortierella alpina]
MVRLQLLGPDPQEPKEAYMRTYMRMWHQLKGSDPGSNGGLRCDPQVDDTLTQNLHVISALADEDKDDASQFRVYTAKFSRVICKEHVATENDKPILAVAAGGAYRNDDEKSPKDQFQLSALVPESSQEEGFQSPLNVAAITRSLQDSIEENAGLPRALQDERFHILSSPYIKKTLTHVRSDTTSTSVPGKADSTPLWTAIAEKVATAGYPFQSTPKGLSHTAALHVNQAAVSVNNHWSQAHYKKSSN